MLQHGAIALFAEVMHRIMRGRSIANEVTRGKPNPPSDLTRALIDAVRLFEELDIGYALIGGIAALRYGRARFTRT